MPAYLYPKDVGNPIYSCMSTSRHVSFFKLTNIMLVEQFEQLAALIQRQRVLSYPGWSSIDLAAVTEPILALLALALIIDYGYMLYLHFQMVKLPYHTIPIARRNHTNTGTTAPRPPPPPSNRQHTPPPRLQTLALLRNPLKEIQHTDSNILDGPPTDNLALRRLDRTRPPRQTRRALRLSATNGRLRRTRRGPGKPREYVLRRSMAVTPETNTHGCWTAAGA